MPPKPQTKDLEDTLNSIQERLSAIQFQLDEHQNRQTTMEAKNDSIQYTLTLFLDHIIPHPNHQIYPTEEILSQHSRP